MGDPDAARIPISTMTAAGGLSGAIAPWSQRNVARIPKVKFINRRRRRFIRKRQCRWTHLKTIPKTCAGVRF